MSIEFRCARCQSLLRVGDDTVGRVAQCPICGTQTHVLGSKPTDEVVEPPFQREAPSIHWVLPTGGIELRYSPAGARAVLSLVLGAFGLCLTMLGLCCSYAVVITLPMAIYGLILGLRSLRSEYRTEAILGTALCGLVLALSLAIMVLTAWISLGGLAGQGVPGWN